MTHKPQTYYLPHHIAWDSITDAVKTMAKDPPTWQDVINNALALISQGEFEGSMKLLEVAAEMRQMAELEQRQFESIRNSAEPTP